LLQALRNVATFEYLPATIPLESLDALEEQHDVKTQSVQTSASLDPGEGVCSTQMPLGSSEEQHKAQFPERRSQRFCWWREPSYSGWNISVDLLVDYIAEHGPYDGLLGFSQGSALICLVLARCSQALNLRGIKFVILFCGYVARPLDCANMHTRIEIPSLHVWGRADAQVCLQTTLI
jgi:hypothetical protein